MFLKPRETFTLRSDEGFGKPVESIMRCEDFKSNFARKLSNRYVSRSPQMTLKSDAGVKLSSNSLNFSIERTPETVQEKPEPCSKVLKCIGKEPVVVSGEVVKIFDKPRSGNSDKRRIEVAALNMEVETLKWQLSQTEANRQMHIALLKQIVTFLNRVKEKIECKDDSANRRDRLSGKALPNSFSSADLPRSRSAVHVNKHLDYPPSSAKKTNARKISKSISNVNGFKELSSSWNQSKLSLTSDAETARKISEEMSRLITLATTVLSTKLPDLANCSDKIFNEPKPHHRPEKEKRKKYESTISLNRIEEGTVNNFVYAENDHSVVANTDKRPLNNGSLNKDFNLTPPETVGLEDELSSVELNEVEHYNICRTNNSMDLKNNKKDDLNRPVNYIEDESGFSSMSSFQEIGIPIISIIPPSPCKGMGFDEEIPDVIEEKEKWKTEALELDKQTVKVFWV